MAPQNGRLLRARAACSVLVVALVFGASPIEAGRNVDPCDSLAAPAEATPGKRGRFEVLPDVDLSEKVEDKLEEIARAYAKRTGKTFVVTSGTRSPEDQAELITGKLLRGEDLTRLYKDKAAVAELKRVFDAARGSKKSRATIVAIVAATIRAQMKRGIFISAHLRAGAADVRSTTMEDADKRAFVLAAQDAGGVSVMFESSPPHFHLQLE